jgi:hypothetical protein
MAEKCEVMWPGIFGTHYCGELEPHQNHACGEPGCSSVLADAAHTKQQNGSQP